MLDKIENIVNSHKFAANYDSCSVGDEIFSFQMYGVSQETLSDYVENYTGPYAFEAIGATLHKQ